MSKHIKDLEDELGVEVFLRRGKRLLGLTDPGKEPIDIVESIMVDTANIKARYAPDQLQRCWFQLP